MPNSNFLKPLTESEIIDYFSDETLIYLIRDASYFRKKFCKNPPKLEHFPRTKLVELYVACRDFATKSIVDALYPVDELKSPVTHLYCSREQFYILSRVRTEWEHGTPEETAAVRTFLSFTLASHRNLSHFPGEVWYGYHKGITTHMIGYIYPCDADTNSMAMDRLELAELPEKLYDHLDLTNESCKRNTYSQISVKSNIVTYTGPIVHKTPLLPDCILCIDKIDYRSQKEATSKNLPILVLHRAKNTICRIHDLYPGGGSIF